MGHWTSMASRSMPRTTTIRMAGITAKTDKCKDMIQTSRKGTITINRIKINYLVSMLIIFKIPMVLDSNKMCITIRMDNISKQIILMVKMSKHTHKTTRIRQMFQINMDIIKTTLKVKVIP